MHQPGEAVERKADRQHADLHDAFLQIPRVARQMAQPLTQALELPRIKALAELREHRLRNDELADEVDQAVDLVDRDADGTRVAGGLGGRRGLWRGCRCSRRGRRRRRGCRAHSPGARSWPRGDFFVFELRACVDPVEDVLHAALVDDGIELQRPAEVERLRHEVLEGRNSADVRVGNDRPELRELGEHAGRFVVGAKDVFVWREADDPARNGGRRCRALDVHERHGRRLHGGRDRIHFRHWQRRCGRQRHVARRQKVLDRFVQDGDSLDVDGATGLCGLDHFPDAVD